MNLYDERACARRERDGAFISYYAVFQNNKEILLLKKKELPTLDQETMLLISFLVISTSFLSQKLRNSFRASRKMNKK